MSSIIEIVKKHEMESGRQQGVQQGHKEKALAIAREMKKDDISISK